MGLIGLGRLLLSFVVIGRWLGLGVLRDGEVMDRREVMDRFERIEDDLRLFCFLFRLNPEECLVRVRKCQNTLL